MPVRVYTSNPIHASEADGSTPKTNEPEDSHDPKAPWQPAAAAAAASTATSASTTASTAADPPAAQPGARPSLPVQTAVPQAPRRTNYQPTQSQQPDPSSTDPSSPPAPQPGAAPVPLAGQPHGAPPPPPLSHPPPPKAGDAPSPYTYTHAAPVVGSSSSAYAASTAYTPRARYHSSSGSGSGSDARNYSHPPGYQQNVHAAEFSSAQLAAHNRSVFHADSGGLGDAEDSVWGTAKRWAAAAGESIMAAEEQIWKKINGD